MTESFVSIERDDTVAIVRFDRKGALNAFSQDLILQLTKTAHALQRDRSLRAVVLTGTPRAFSAGIDLADQSIWDRGTHTSLELREIFYRGVKLCQAWEEMPQITVCAIEGLAVGAGCAIALACDWRVMASDAYLYVPEVKVGLNLQWGALPRLVAQVGPSKAKQICLLDEKMGAEQALDWGLVDRIAKPGEAIQVAAEMAAKAASMPGVAATMIKEGVNAIAGALHRVSSFADADQSQLCAFLDDAKQARAAFAQKRA